MTPKLADFSNDCRDMSLEQFSSRHGKAFFLSHGSSGDLQRPSIVGSTQMVDPGSESEQRRAPQADFLVYPIRQTGRSPFPNFISIGRTRNNDIVIDDASLSKFHAYIKAAAGGVHFIQDAGSSNGTKLDDTRVPKKEEGNAVQLSNGVRVTLGRIDLTYLTAEAFIDLVNRSFPNP